MTLTGLHRNKKVKLVVSRALIYLWRRPELGGVGLYLLWAVLLGLNSIGLQYDEALLQHGAVHLLNSRAEPSFAHDAGSWVYGAGRFWPLMVVPYVGAVKDYLLLIPFALFGPQVWVARAVAALLGAFGIWGIARLLRAELNAKVAAAVAFIVAIHPAYLIHTLYDNGTVGVWIATFGFISLTLLAYKQRRTSWAAFWLGLAMGAGVWNRVNFTWFLGAAFLAAVLVFRKKLLLPRYHLVSLIAGGVIGGAPLLLYQVLSGWAIFGFIRGAQAQDSLGSLLLRRLPMLAETLLLNSENSALWNGLPSPAWQGYLLSIVLAGALFVCLFCKAHSHDRLTAWGCASALTCLVFVFLMFGSRLPVAPHHFVTLIPIAAIVIVAASQYLILRWRALRPLVLTALLAYAGAALYWDASAARSLRRTGGFNAWSNAISAVNNHLQTHYRGREIHILDWGLQNNLYVLSNAQLRSRELFWGATKEGDGFGLPWSEVISAGGVYLTNADGNLNFTAATEGVRAALAASGQSFNRVKFHQKSGALYAEMLEIFPASIQSVPTAAKETFSAAPNPLRVCDGSGLGTTTLSWAVDGATLTEVHIGAPDGALLTRQGLRGTAITGKWVSAGMTFYLQDVSGGKPLTLENTIATVTVNITTEGCP